MEELTADSSWSMDFAKRVMTVTSFLSTTAAQIVIGTRCTLVSYATNSSKTNVASDSSV